MLNADLHNSTACSRASWLYAGPALDASYIRLDGLCSVGCDTVIKLAAKCMSAAPSACASQLDGSCLGTGTPKLTQQFRHCRTTARLPAAPSVNVVAGLHFEPSPAPAGPGRHKATHADMSHAGHRQCRLTTLKSKPQTPNLPPH